MTSTWRTIAAALLLAWALVSVAVCATSTRAAEQPWTPDALQARALFWADTYGVSEAWMDSVFECESHYDATLVGAHGEIGPGQWMLATWQAYATGDINDPDTNIRETVRAHANGLAWQWSCG